MHMLSHEIDDLFSLLALMIFADKKIVEDEVRAFVRLANKLQIARDLEPRLSEAKLSVWYEENKSGIRAIFEGPNFEPWFFNKIHLLKDIPNKLAILGVLCDIASADGEVHISEKALVKLTAQSWGIAI